MHHDLISDPAPLATGDGRRVWHFRPPRGGDFGRLLIDEGLVCAEFGVREDLSEHMDPGQVLDAVEMANPNEKPSRIRTMSTQLNALVNVMQRGDLVLASLPGGDTIGIGMIDPDLREDPEGRPARSVRWLRDPVPHSAFLPDLLTVTGTLVNITEVTRPGIIDRVRGLIRDGRDPGPSGPEGTVPATLNALLAREHERIKDRIGAVFTGHAMADLVGELLRLEGLTVSVGAPGPDGGVDLIAGGGSMGIAPPRIVGQVKSGLQVTGDEALQGLIGNLHGAGGDTALLVSWSGVTRQARGRAYAMGFRVQIWDGDEVVRRFLTGYDRLPDRIRDAVRLNPVNTYRLAD